MTLLCSARYLQQGVRRLAASCPSDEQVGKRRAKLKSIITTISLFPIEWRHWACLRTVQSPSYPSSPRQQLRLSPSHRPIG
ncbi:hypothetical protein RHGRI_024476 [Rhododendron griersonianum]|uniref:Uncharacterized protein n=1 Tax=Rhododendron griersonianum TaxID=479676 RepID=A0AAV6J7L0_9ERIC|nr:hypothetical protein RHGRI_024476 [Rhododendron griersonianum]